ncbi:type VII secretion target [Hamadaea tsunoensis]|uniref:type VII secretion target n=1 Tax=Hamadaea tsunoensis TaxID=53368 RepID=UPI00042826A0|nr:type VII secretion target [Hamadaea tsunoensis]
MGAEIQFPVAIVRQHAGTVDQVADAVELARSAVHEVSMDTQAYGQLCQFLPAILSPVFGLAVDALHESVGSLQETATKLRTAASTTQSTDVQAGQQTAAIPAQHPGLNLPL